MERFDPSVIPAKAGISGSKHFAPLPEAPAFAGATAVGNDHPLIKSKPAELPKEPAGSITYLYYAVIALTTPAPTVRPPSRIEKRRPCSIAIGAMSLTPSFTLSPGMTISVPSGRTTSPVTSVVRK
jgi:hypothetical protein